MTISDADFAALKEEVTALRNEMGPIVDTGAAQIHERMVQLGNAMNGVVARMEGITGGTTVTDYVDSRIAAIPASSSEPDQRIPAMQIELAKVKASVAAIPAGKPGLPGGSGVAELPGLGQGVSMVIPGANGVPTVGHAFFGGGGDQGLRVLYNHKGYNPTDGSGTHVDPKLMQLRIDFEKDGAISMNHFKPLQDKNGNPLPAGPYDNLPGKAIVFRPGGSEPDGRRGKYADIFSGLQNRGLRFGVAGSTAPNAVDEWSITIEPDGSVKTR